MCSAYGRPPKANDGVGKGDDQIELCLLVSNSVTEHTGFGNFLGASPCSWRGDENQTVRTICAACVIHQVEDNCSLTGSLVFQNDMEMKNQIIKKKRQNNSLEAVRKRSFSKDDPHDVIPKLVLLKLSSHKRFKNNCLKTFQVLV